MKEPKAIVANGGDSHLSHVQPFVDAYQRYILRHISAHASIFEPGRAQALVDDCNQHRTPIAFQTFAILANGMLMYITPRS